jgi:chromosome segregation ATPase
VSGLQAHGFALSQLERQQKEQQQQNSLFSGTEAGELRDQIQGLSQTLQDVTNRSHQLEKELAAKEAATQKLQHEKEALECGPHHAKICSLIFNSFMPLFGRSM